MSGTEILVMNVRYGKPAVLAAAGMNAVINRVVEANDPHRTDKDFL
jgi:hypothetical protein